MRMLRKRINRLRGRTNEQAEPDDTPTRASSSERPGKQDALAAFIGAVQGIPSGMANGVLAGVNPVYGIYTLLAGTPATGLLASTRLMIFNTTSAMILVAVSGMGGLTGEDRVQALFIIALVAGAFQILLGVLGLGSLTRFVSNATMTGFLTGVAVLLVLGQLPDLVGYPAEGRNKVAQTLNLVENIDQIDPASTVIGVGSLLLMFALARTRLASFSLLIALVVAMVVAWAGDWDSVALVSSLGEIPRSLPRPGLPQLNLLPQVAVAGVAVGMVGLLQAAGVAQRYPNPDGSDTNDSRDFWAQGTGNVVCAFTQSMPGGGSVSGTALNVAAGAQTRWAAVLQGPIVIALILAFSGLLELIPMAALAALLIYSGALAVNVQVVTSTGRATKSSAITMIVTFVATLFFPLQYAVMLGIVLGGVLYIYRSSADIRVVALRRAGDKTVESEPPATLPDDSVTVLDIYGSLFYAGARRLGELLPSARNTHHAVVILRMRGHRELGSTFLGVVGRYAEQLRANDGKLLLAGVDPNAKARMEKTGHLAKIGEENVFTANEVLGASTDAAFDAGEAWLKQARAESARGVGADSQRSSGEEVRTQE
jgi:SulP family sulfate permease